MASTRLLSPSGIGEGEGWQGDVLAFLALFTLLHQLSTGEPQRSKPVAVGPRLTFEQVRALAQSVGFPDANLAAAVAMAESSGVVTAAGDGGESVGLWQVNTRFHPDYSAELLARSAEYNARAAFTISKGGTDWSPWTTFRNGAYKAYLANA